jgi:hypothetical protein
MKAEMQNYSLVWCPLSGTGLLTATGDGLFQPTKAKIEEPSFKGENL